MHPSKETYFEYINLIVYFSQYQQKTATNIFAEKMYSKFATVNIYHTKAF